MIELHPIKRTDPRLLANMCIHYTQPQGFVGRNICYAVMFGTRWYGTIVGGSATLHLPGRDEFFNITKQDKLKRLNCVINNIFYHIEKRDGKYPLRNFTVKVLQLWRERIRTDWEDKYGDMVIGFETLIELPRTGELYKRDGWVEVGQTHGCTCKRVAGNEPGRFTGQRVWDRENLKPKLVLCKSVET